MHRRNCYSFLSAADKVALIKQYEESRSSENVSTFDVMTDFYSSSAYQQEIAWNDHLQSKNYFFWRTHFLQSYDNEDMHLPDDNDDDSFDEIDESNNFDEYTDDYAVRRRQPDWWKIDVFPTDVNEYEEEDD